MPIPNSDSVPREFMPGCESGAPNLAPGTQGASGRAADDVPAGPVTLQGIGAWQPSSRYDAPTSGTVMPGQSEPSQITGGDGGYTSTGAGRGSGEHFPRRPGQQAAS